MMDSIPAHEVSPSGATAHPRPAPVMPPACVPGLPDAVVAILLEAHKRHVSSGLYSHREATKPKYSLPGVTEHYRKGALENAAKANAIVHALLDADHHAEADALRANAALLEEALHAVPADMLERMDLLDAALPGERADMAREGA